MTALVLIVVLFIIVNLVRNKGLYGSRENVSPQLLEAYDYLVAHLDSKVVVGRPSFSQLQGIVVKIGTEQVHIAEGDDGAVFLGHNLDTVGLFLGNTNGWHFRELFYHSLDGRTIHMQ